MNESKVFFVKDYLIKNKRKGISNVDAILGTIGIRTSRLGSIIHVLRNRHGMMIETEVKRDKAGNYIDCVYRFKGYI